ncbi:hypothetical protein FPV67DRAFT_388427 [Lyophyllum atratum]|nr:hypothetical protein FPV67DRAFT_388427 [Lyophyllum atratum]
MASPPPYNAPPPTNPDTRQLPSGWITQFDANYKAWFYVNTQANPPVTTWTHPLGPPPPPPPTQYAPPSGPPPPNSGTHPGYGSDSKTGYGDNKSSSGYDERPHGQDGGIHSSRGMVGREGMGTTSSSSSSSMEAGAAAENPRRLERQQVEACSVAYLAGSSAERWAVGAVMVVGVGCTEGSNTCSTVSRRRSRVAVWVALG